MPARLDGLDLTDPDLRTHEHVADLDERRNHRPTRQVGRHPAPAASAAFTNPSDDAASPPSVPATVKPPTQSEHEAFRLTPD